MVDESNTESSSEYTKDMAASDGHGDGEKFMDEESDTDGVSKIFVHHTREEV